MKSLNKIFKSFNKTLADLDDYIAKTHEQINENDEAMALLQSENMEHRFNVEKAANAHNKIAALIGDE